MLVTAILYLIDLKELNFLHGVIHDDLAKILSDVTEGDGALTAEDFDDILPRLTAGLGEYLMNFYTVYIHFV